MVRDCPDARWLPSRHHFALARLVAFGVARRKELKPIDANHLLLAIDGDQSAVENYTVSIWIVSTAVCYIAAALPFQFGIALFIAVPLAVVAVQLPIPVIGLLVKDKKVIAAALMVLMILASYYFVTAPSPVRYIAWLFFGVIALNSIAWLIMAMLRRPVRDLEQRCGI